MRNILLSNLSISMNLVSAVGLFKDFCHVFCKIVKLNSAWVAISLRWEEVKLQFQGVKLPVQSAGLSGMG